LQVSGAGVSIMSGRHSGPVCSSTERVRRLEDLQFALGEGPCHDAFVTGDIVNEPDLVSRSSGSWPSYAPQALGLGACAVFAFPIRVSSHTIGVLTLYQDSAGPLTSAQVADGRIVADVLATVMNAIQQQSQRPLLANVLSDAAAHRAEVHQASGMVAIQLGIDVADALMRIRAHSFATNQPVATTAQEIVAHRLRLHDDREHDHKADP
jgi:hypothetical protein